MKPRFVLVALFFVVSIGSARIHAQLEPVVRDSFLEPVNARVLRTTTDIPVWKSTARLYWRGSAAVMFLGLLGSLFAFVSGQRSDSKGKGPLAWPAISAFVIGLGVSGLTWWLQNGFAVDNKGYMKAAGEAEDLVAQLTTQINVYKATTFEDLDKALSFLKEHITPLSERLQAVQNRLIVLVRSVEPVAYAQEYQQMQPSLSANGVGDCNLLSQSEANSRVAAIERVVNSLPKATGVKITPADRDSVRAYVAKYGAFAQYQDKAQIQTKLTLGQTFTNPKVLDAFLQSERKSGQFTPEQRIEVARKQVTSKSMTSVDGFIETTQTISVPGGTIGLSAVDKRQGSFQFAFDVKPANDGMATVYLRNIEITQDASGGSTRWRFEILSFGSVVMSLPEQRWDDSGHPTRCAIDGGAGFSAAMKSPQGGVPITIVGMKPKVTGG